MKLDKKSTQKPRVLMVLPTLGQRPELLKQTLESIKAQVEVPYDIVMIFPLDNKETMDLAKEYGATTVKDPGGISKALNAGIATAKDHHEFIGWIGDDDLLTTKSLETAVTMLDEKPEAVLAYGYCDYINDEGNKLFTSHAGNLAPWLMTWGPNLVPCPGIIFRKSSLDKVGIFDENNKYSMDLDILLRLRKIGKFINTKKTLAAFRWHETSTTVANRSKARSEIIDVKNKHMAQPFKILIPLLEPLVKLVSAVAAKQVNSKATAKK